MFKYNHLLYNLYVHCLVKACTHTCVYIYLSTSSSWLALKSSMSRQQREISTKNEIKWGRERHARTERERDFQGKLQLWVQRGGNEGRMWDHFNLIITFILRGVITQPFIRIFFFLKLAGGLRGLKSTATESHWEATAIYSDETTPVFTHSGNYRFLSLGLFYITQLGLSGINANAIHCAWKQVIPQQRGD